MAMTVRRHQHNWLQQLSGAATLHSGSWHASMLPRLLTGVVLLLQLQRRLLLLLLLVVLVVAAVVCCLLILSCCSWMTLSSRQSWCRASR